ncbi:Ctf8-domain-containing protein [Phakopsora pachyrhizi]|uniref:Ctf8-domain-containing protein n=1 Tax=Phakopsora pachyrhizi TaxID=170000 RepID=A0AAV0BT07_PHAPC|nr:Ctf8-domain-containing protein [Phakopsora pachyrhizi]CAH7690585.1 Ctf8-domain-containing protein [Phakopsora pachyrhizi]
MRFPISITPHSQSSSDLNVETIDSTTSIVRLNDRETLIVELQGKLELSFSDQLDSVPVEQLTEDDKELRLGLEIGKLDLSNQEKPYLRIGNHQLEGKFIKLTNPLTVLRKTEWKRKHEDGGEEQGFDIVAIVERKLVFSKRPHPIPIS